MDYEVGRTHAHTNTHAHTHTNDEQIERIDMHEKQSVWSDGIFFTAVKIQRNRDNYAMLRKLEPEDDFKYFFYWKLN